MRWMDDSVGAKLYVARVGRKKPRWLDKQEGWLYELYVWRQARRIERKGKD